MPQPGKSRSRLSAADVVGLMPMIAITLGLFVMPWNTFVGDFPMKQKLLATGPGLGALVATLSWLYRSRRAGKPRITQN